MTARTYETPAAFEATIEARLRNARRGLERTGQLLVFDRLLARLVATFGNAMTLEGGLVLELRLNRARATKDIDLRLEGSPDQLLERLQAAGREDLGDFMTFEVVLDEEHPTIRNEGMQYPDGEALDR